MAKSVLPFVALGGCASAQPPPPPTEIAVAAVPSSALAKPTSPPRPSPTASAASPAPARVPEFVYADAPGVEAPSEAAGFSAKLWDSFVRPSLRFSGLPPWGFAEASKIRTKQGRLPLARGLLGAFRLVVASPWFARLYAEARAESLSPPASEPLPVRSLEEIHRERVEQMEQALELLERTLTLPQANPAAGAELAPILALQRAQLEERRRNPSALQHEADQEREAATRRAEEAKAALQAHHDSAPELARAWPEDPKLFVAHRIDEAIELTAGIDFNARTVHRGGYRVFVDPAYESQSLAWKAAFRAGKPTFEAVRAFGVTWQKDLRAGRW